MITIRELVNRIRWDPEFGRGEFSIGYYDRVEEHLILAPLEATSFDSEDHFSLNAMGPDGQVHSIPLHRVYEVYRDGQCIWHRERRHS